MFTDLMASVIEYMCGKISRGGLWIKAGVTRNVLNIYKSLAHIKQFPFNLWLVNYCQEHIMAR